MTVVEKKNNKNINFNGNVFILIKSEKSNKYNKVLKINPDFEKDNLPDLLKHYHYFKIIESINIIIITVLKNKILYLKNQKIKI